MSTVYNIINTAINNRINTKLGVTKPLNRNTMKTTGQLMITNFPIGTTLIYQGSNATIVGYNYDDANPLAILQVEHYAIPFKATVSYNKLVELTN